MITLIQKIKRRFLSRKDSEHEQALIRFVNVFVISALYNIAVLTDLVSYVGWQITFAAPLLILSASLLILAAIYIHPAPSKVRRIVGMCVDYGAIGATMHIGGEPLSALYVMLIWVTVGHGIRYGHEYLRIAVGLGIASFIAVALFTPFWREAPALSWGLAIGIGIVPMYLENLLKALTRSRETAIKASETKSQFLATMSHELRTPLNGVVGIGELLSATVLSAEQEKYVSILRSASAALLSQVNQVLDFSEIEAGKIATNVERFSIRELVADVINLQKASATAKGLLLSDEIAADIPALLEGDLSHTRQILLNLVNNAIKFTNDGYVKVSASLILEDTATDLVRFTVIDTGIGIPVEARDRVLNPFEQVDKNLSRRAGGVGLGMSIVAMLVKLLNGRLQILDNAHGGTCVVVELHYRRIEAQPISTTSNVVSFQDPFLQHRMRTPSKRFLVIDDIEANREVLKGILEKGGHTCITVGDADKFLDLVAYEAFNGIFIDLHMPGVSGFELIHHVRIMEAGGTRTPIVAVSADVTVDTLKQIEVHSVAATLSKPLSARKVLDCVSKLLAHEAVATTKTATASVVEPLALTAVIDWAFYQECLGDGIEPDVLLPILTKAQTELQTVVARLIEALQERKLENVRDDAHALRGIASYLGAHRLVKYCQDYFAQQHLSKILSAKSADQYTRDLQEEIKEIDREMPAIIEQIKKYRRVS